MASTSFSLSHQFTGGKFSALRSPDHLNLRRQQFRFLVSCATAERTSGNAVQKASFYQVLGVQTGATRQEIKSAYRKLARVLHPDVASDGGGDDTSAADEFMRVHAAYVTLSDPEKRGIYDGSLLRLRRTAGSCSELTSWRRTWETDQCW